MADAFARYHKRVEAKFPDEKQHLRLDRVREYIDGTFRLYCNQSGVEIEDSSSYAPQLNGVAEHMNQTIGERMRALMFDATLPLVFWPYTLHAAVYLINRSPTRTNPNMITPFERWYERKPDLSSLRIFGCIAHRHIPAEVRQQQATSQWKKGELVNAKLTPRTGKHLLVGYTDTGYTVIDHVTKKVTATCDVRFLEDQNISSFDSLTHDSFPASDLALTLNLEQATQTEDHQQQRAETGTQTSLLETDHMYASYAMKITQSLKKRLLEESVPKTFDQITDNLFENEWRTALAKELEAMKEHTVFTIIPKQKTSLLIDTKWLFNLKYDADGESYAKARLVARGFRDHQQYPIGETYAPVVDW